MFTGEYGILIQAQRAKDETENTKVQDSLGNTVWIPAGFKVVNSGDNVEDGIIIEDVTNEKTIGSQFLDTYRRNRNK